MLNFASIPKYCINLKRRPDRKESAEKEFAKIGLTVEFVEAIDHLIYKPGDTPNYANMLSQLSVVEKATEEYIFITEDDVKFCDDFLLRMRYVERSGVDFDIFFLGGWHMDKTDLKQIDKYLYKVTRMAGSHAYILRDTTYKLFIDKIRENQGMDQFLSDVMLKEFTGVAFLPMMAGTIDSYSDIAMRVTDYNQSFKSYQQEAVFYE